MFLRVKLKFENNPEIYDSLLATQGVWLIKNSPYDTYWGIGKYDTRYNHPGIRLTRVRHMF